MRGPWKFGICGISALAASSFLMPSSVRSFNLSTLPSNIRKNMGIGRPVNDENCIIEKASTHTERRRKTNSKTDIFQEPMKKCETNSTPTASNINLNIKPIMLSAILFAHAFFLPQAAMSKDEGAPSAATGSTPTTTTTTTESPTAMGKSRYWNIINSGDISDVQYANERLIDHAVGTINTMYYDNSGGARFTTKDMYDRWKVMRVYAKDGIDGVKGMYSSRDVSKDSSSAETPKKYAFIPQKFLIEGDSIKLQKQHLFYESDLIPKLKMPSGAFDSRDNAVASLKWLVSTLDDPYSKYLTREELNKELKVRDDGFLGFGAIVEAPPKNILEENKNTLKLKAQEMPQGKFDKSQKSLLSPTRVANLPMVTAIIPDSPAERAGIVVGDRIVAVGSDNFVGLGRDEVSKRLNDVYSGAENYVGYPEFSVAKPIMRAVEDNDEEPVGRDSPQKEQLVGYKLSRARLPTASLEPFKPYRGIVPPASATTPEVDFVSGGDAVVHWELLMPKDSIFRKYMAGSDREAQTTEKIGYIRLTRFSRLSTAGYTKAIEELERAGAQSYILDVRNNYGGVIQESMLTAATLLRDPHTVLCYTLNSRGGFTPHDAEEYIVDERYPGYFLSSEPKSATFDQVKRENPKFVSGDGWDPPSSYASIHEQRMTGNYKRPTGIASINPFKTRFDNSRPIEEIKQLRAQKNVVVLMNEGTASAAEVFVSSLHDNGRTVALIGTKTYGKGLIQHTFPMPDGGGLRLTVAEYLTPALQHVTKVGGAQYDKNGDFVGGGVKPDIYCPSTQGIPSNIGADICVGLAVDALEDANSEESKLGVNLSPDESVVSRRGGTEGGSFRRRTLNQGVVRDTF